MNKKTLYRAIVFLKQTIPCPKADNPAEIENKIPTLLTKVHDSKETVMTYVEQLFAAGIIQAYRVVYSPDGTGAEGSWYMDGAVVYLPDDVKSGGCIG